METHRFDRLTSTLARADSRRSAMRLLAGGLTTGLLARRATTPVRAQSDETDIGGFPTVLCGQSRVILAVDHFNCGACGVACGENQICLAGECRLVFGR
jgi:hypothetical protein